MPQLLKKPQVLEAGRFADADARIDPENDQMVQSKELQVLDTGNSVCASAITDRMKNLFPKHQMTNITGEIMSIVSSWN